MAIYSFGITTQSRGRRTRGGKVMTTSAAHAVAYAQRTSLRDEWTGERKTYGNKGENDLMPGSAITILNDGSEYQGDLQALWSQFDAVENRKDSRVCRTMVGALPHELSDEQCKAIVKRFGESLAKQYNCVVSAAIHYPPKNGDKRNRHVHYVMSTREYGPNGVGAKIERLDQVSNKNIYKGKKNGEYYRMREMWADAANVELIEVNIAPIDHRSNADRGIAKAPSVHLGPVATAIKRRKNIKTRREEYAESLAKIYADGLALDPNNSTIDELKEQLNRIGNNRSEIENEIAAITKNLADIEKRETKLDERVSIDFEAFWSSIAFDKLVKPFSKREIDAESIDATDRSDKGIYLVGKALEANHRRLDAINKFRPPLTRDDLIIRLRRRYVVKPVIEYIDAQIEANNKIARLDPSKAAMLKAENNILAIKRKAPSKTEWFDVLDKRFTKELNKHKREFTEIEKRELPKWNKYIQDLNTRSGALADKLDELGGIDRYQAAAASVARAEKEARAVAGHLKHAGRLGGEYRRTAVAAAKASVSHLRDCGKTHEEIEAILDAERIADEIARQRAQGTADAIKQSVDFMDAIFGKRVATKYAGKHLIPKEVTRDGYIRHKATPQELDAHSNWAKNRNGLRNLSERNVAGGETESASTIKTADPGSVLSGHARDGQLIAPVLRRKRP